MEKLISLLAVGTKFPFASRTSTVITETSRPSARIVLRSGVNAMAAGSPAVTMVLVMTGTPKL